jgi:hypothetical protein
MEAFSEVIKYYVPVFILILGWLLKMLDDRSKANRDDKRKLKKALFYLLEVRYQLKLLVIEDMQLNYFIKMFKKHLGHIPEIANLDDDVLKKIIKPLLNKVIEKPFTSEKDRDELKTNYLKSVDNLSEVDPILAFRLHGRQNVIQLMTEALDRSQSVMGSVPVERPEDMERIINAIKKTGPKILDEALLDIEMILAGIAKSISRKTFRQVKRRLSTVLQPKDQQDMELLFKKLLTAYFDALQTPQSTQQ